LLLIGISIRQIEYLLRFTGIYVVECSDVVPLVVCAGKTRFGSW